MTFLPAQKSTFTWSTILLWLGCALTGIYVWLFYTTPIAALGLHPRSREPVDRLGFHMWQAFHPMELVQQWFGDGHLLNACLERLPILLVATCILAAAFYVGRGLLVGIGALSSLTRIESFVFGTGLGLNTLSLLTLLVGMAGWLRSPIGVVVVLVSVGMICLLNKFRSSNDSIPIPSTPDATSTIDRLLVVAIVAFSVLLIVGSLMPPWHFDVKAYHLQAPKEWFLNGQITFMPHNVYANMPLGSEMHALLAMMFWPGQDGWWWGAMVGKVVIAAFAPLTACALFAFGKRFLTQRIGLVAALLFVSCPWVAFLSFGGLIECVLGFYLLLGFYALALRARSDEKSGGQDRKQFAFLIVAGLCAGSAAACKYPAIVFVVIPLALAAMAWRPVSNLREMALWSTVRELDVRAAILFLLAVGVAAGPWYAKNLVMTGNPTYPMLYSVFGGEGWDDQKDERWRHAHSAPTDPDGRLFTLNQIRQSAEVLGWKSAGHSPLLLPLVAVGLFAASYRRWMVPLAVFAVYFVIVWFCMTHHFDRFLTPVLPAIALLGAIGWSAVENSRVRRFAVFALTVGVVCNGLLSVSTVLGDNRFFVPLEQARASRIHPVHQFINDELNDNDRVLMVGEATPFNVSVPHLYNSCFDDCRLTEMMQNKTKSQRVAAIHTAGITHVFINWLDIAAYRREGDYGYSPYVDRQRIYNELVYGDELLVPIDTGMPPSMAELFRVATPGDS